ncbi:MAG: dephospho-CoA kinase [Clostridiales bacterium]|nr:dephospho-CoA kinase [Clostridiales bacterium]
MFIIGLTGGIGSGKTEATRYLRNKGIHVIDTDEISREIVYPGSKALKQIIKHFGKEIINKDGFLNREALAQIVFSDNSQLAILNGIMHPMIINEITKSLKKIKDKIVVIDAPLLIETSLNTKCDEVWVVDVPEKIQIERIKKRDNLHETDINMRIQTQIRREERNKYAHVIIDNSKDLQHLHEQIDKALNRIGDRE